MEILKVIGLIYLAVISLVSVVVCSVDKIRAQKNEWRISEATLFMLSFLGGAAAMLATMKTIRHKTKHKRFMIGLPIIIALHIVLIYFIVRS